MLHVVPGETGGIEVYSRELARALARIRPDVEWLAFVPKEFDGPLQGARPIRTTVPGRSRIRRVLGEQVLLPRLVARHRIDLLHSVASSAPLRAAAVQVVTIHDVNYALAPEGHTRGMSRGQRIVVPAAARSADRVIAVSEYSRTTAIATLGVAPDRI